jgi:very-short-patch-repair endonuclease
MARVFLGSEALRAGEVTEHQLRKFHRRLLPDVYAPKWQPLVLTDRATAAWLWSHRRGVIAGSAASGLHGAEYVDDNVPIELIWPNHRAPRGVITRDDLILPGEVETLAGLPVTTAARTAFDLARRGPEWKAVAGLDALVRATEYKDADVLPMVGCHPHARGIRRVGRMLGLVDAGAESRKESWLRLVVINGGYPRPQTQIPVLDPDGFPRYRLDMGWPELMVAVEYDGDQHRTDPDRYRRDIIRSEYIARLGWRRVRVIARDRAPEILWRLRQIWPR